MCNHRSADSPSKGEEPQRGSLTSLDPLETSAEPTELSSDAVIRHPRYGSIECDDKPPAQPFEQQFRHSGWAPQRRKIYEAMQRTHCSNRRQQRFADCGANVWIRIDQAEDRVCMTADLCRDRLCIPCQTARRAKLMASLSQQLLDRRGKCRFVTLTLRSSPGERLQDKLKELAAAFKRIKDSKWWKSRVVGGVKILEVTVGRQGNWHCHYHLLIESDYLVFTELQEQWRGASRGSFMVDVQAIRKDDSAISYVTKYATKPASTDVVNSPAHLDEFLLSIKGVRLLQLFGSWRAIKEPTIKKEQLRPLMSLGTLLASRHTDDAAAKLFARCCREIPWFTKRLKWIGVTGPPQQPD